MLRVTLVCGCACVVAASAAARPQQRPQLARALLRPRHSAWQPRPNGRRQRPCNSTGEGYLARPRVSALVQSFQNGDNAAQMGAGLHAAPGLEVIVNDDSGADHEKWRAALRGPNDYLISSPNLHEVRAYNRMARFASGEFLLLLQGDFCLPASAAWLEEGLRLFAEFPRLGMLGGNFGFDAVPYKDVAINISYGAPPCKPIPLQTASGAPLRFVAGVNVGPLLLRRETFLQLGGFDEAFSCVGEPGIHLDMDLSLALWRHGWQVAVWYSAVSNGVGGRRTLRNHAQRRARRQNDVFNGERCRHALEAHDDAAVDEANRGLFVPSGTPRGRRTQAYARLGWRKPRACLATANV
jgi:hypothetical protein